MKTEEEVKEMLIKTKDTLVDATGEQVLIFQGMAKALRYVLDEKDDTDGTDEQKN